jgi:hypothetical protein
LTASQCTAPELGYTLRVLGRIWLVLLTIVVLAAPAQVEIPEIVDVQTSATASDEAAVTHVQVVPESHSLDATFRSVPHEHAMASDPGSTRVFRPPRSSFG